MTAEEAISNRDLSGKVAIGSGGYSGPGLETRGLRGHLGRRHVARQPWA
jgi:hypothetical protein